MIPFDLVRWFRRRMLPLVIGAALLSASAAPIAYHVEKRRELWQGARAEAARAADVLAAEIEQHPTLWRYNLVKLSERLSSEGLGQVPALVIHDADGVAVPIGPALGLPASAGEARPAPQRRGVGGRAKPDPIDRLLWGQARVVLGRPVATVWVAADTAPLWAGTLTLSCLCALLAVALAALLYLLPMRAIRTAQRRIAALTGRLALTLQEEDRRRIARDLHDGAGQALTAARLQLLAAARGLARRREGVPEDQGDANREAMARATRHLDEALEEVRRSAFALQPPALHTLGLSGALQRHCADFAAATGLLVTCQMDPLVGAVPEAVEVACYRIVQEALANTARHAGATCAWVVLRREAGHGGLHLDISDDGQGRPDRLTPAGGLIGIGDRARLLGGSLALSKRYEGGLRIQVHLPI